MPGKDHTFDAAPAAAGEELHVRNSDRNEALRQLNDDLTNLARNLIAAFVIVDRDLTIRRFTPLAQCIFNFTDHDIGGSVWRVKAALNLPDLEDWISQTIQTGEQREQQAEDTEGRCFIVRSRPYINTRNEIDGAILMFVDITERNRIELERHRFVSLAENSPEFIGMCDMEFKPFFVNRAGMDLVGLDDLKQATSVQVKDFFFPEDQTMIMEKFFPAVFRDKYGKIEVRFRHFKSGAPIWMIYNVMLLKAPDGDPVGYGTFSQNITERRRAEQKFSGLLESAPDAMVITDYLGRITIVNAQAERMFGYSRGELVGQPVEILVPPRYRERHPHYRAAFLTNPHARFMGEGLELSGCRKDGTEFPVEISLGPLRTDEGMLVSAAVRDITERKEAERALKRAHEQIRQSAAELDRKVVERTAKLRESVESLESLTYTMAHDLRAPVRAMKGFADALIEDVPLDETGKLYVQRILEASERMDQLVNDLLDYGQLAHLDFPLRALDLGRQIQKAISQQAEQIKGTHAEVHLPDQFPAVTGNETLLNQILNNLLSNALKFVGPGVKPSITIRTEEHDSVVRLWVEDNGIGIAPQYQERIFGLFQRLHTVEEFPGTGIGLAIVKRATERMGGRVGLKSAEGEGSKFWVELNQAVPPNAPGLTISAD